MLCCSSPQGGKTTNWRAGCGKSASPVRREGRRKPMRCSYPYRMAVVVRLDCLDLPVTIYFEGTKMMFS